MTHDSGRLQAYADGGLTPQEQATVVAHLQECADCRETLARLQHRSHEVARRLAVLDPQPAERVSPVQALARFRREVIEPKPSSWTRLQRRFDMTRTSIVGRWRPVAATLTVAAIIVVLTVAPLRAVVADFLSLFRVQQFTAIPVNPERIEQLEAAMRSLEGQFDPRMLGEPIILREPGPTQVVNDVNEAAALAGFTPRLPTALPAEATLERIVVEGGPAMRMEGDWAVARAVLARLGIEADGLPESGTAAVEVDIPTMIRLEYSLGEMHIGVFQLPAPTATLPEGVSLTVLGELFLRSLGLPADDARRLASAIDWTSTAVLPIPTNVARFREVQVDGVTGLLLEQEMTEGDAHYSRLWSVLVVLWQRDGMVYAVAGEGLSNTALLQIADSLR